MATPRPLASVPDPQRTRSVPRGDSYSGPGQINTFPLVSVGQALQEGCLFALDRAETGIKLCHPPAGGRSLGGAPSLFDLQARDL